MPCPRIFVLPDSMRNPDLKRADAPGEARRAHLCRARPVRVTATMERVAADPAGRGQEQRSFVEAGMLGNAFRRPTGAHTDGKAGETNSALAGRSKENAVAASSRAYAQ